MEPRKTTSFACLTLVCSITLALAMVCLCGNVRACPPTQTPMPTPTPSTAVTLTRFEATAVDGGVLIEWETTLEIDTVGFNLYRDDMQVNGTLIPAKALGSVYGGSYSFFNAGAVSGAYLLEEIEVGSSTRHYGPVMTQATSASSAVNVARMNATGSTSAGVLLLALVALAMTQALLMVLDWAADALLMISRLIIS